jgi:hypothetical protein
MPSYRTRLQVAGFKEVLSIRVPPLLHGVLMFEVCDNARNWNLTFAQEFSEEPEVVQFRRREPRGCLAKYKQVNAALLVQIANQVHSVLYCHVAYVVLNMRPIETYCVPDQELVQSRVDLVTAIIQRAGVYASGDLCYGMTVEEIDD